MTVDAFRGRYRLADASSWRKGQYDYGADRLDELLLDESHVAQTSPGGIAKGFKLTLLWWRAEFVTTLLSLASFMTMVIILRKYDARDSTDLGLPSHLNLNGIVAAIATVNRAFLMVPVASAIAQELWIYYAAESQKQQCTSRLRAMNTFDTASRSVWGSLVFLVHFRGRRIVASLGALVTILSLSFSIFAQQLISYDRIISLPAGSSLSPGNVPRSEYWGAIWGNLAEGLAGPPLQMIAAVYSGAISGDATPMSATCLTGNCTWPLTPSLAVCGGCVKTTYSEPSCWMSNSLLPLCNYTLPSGSVATIVDQSSSYANLESGNPGFVSIPNGYGAHYNTTEADHLYIVNFDLFGVPYDTFGGQLNHSVTLNAFECALWMCVQTYNTSVIATKQVETITAVTDAKVQLNSYDLSSNITFPPLPSSADPHSTASFKVMGYALAAFNEYLYKAFAGTVGLDTESQAFSSDLMHGIWNGTTNIDAWISSLATSMTNVVRTTNPTGRPQYNGTAYGLGVRVRWAWISVPFALVLVSIILLIAVIVRTEYSPVRPWKGHPLTFLMFDVDFQLRKSVMGKADQPRGIEQAVGDTTVRLIDDPHELRKFKCC